MKIKELESILPITRANIRFYEKEDLLHPERENNGYRDYGEEDVERLKKIIIFRKLGFTIPDIKRILDGEVSTSELMAQNIESLEEQMRELQGAIHICKRMTEDESLDEHFPTEKYWEMLHQEEMAGNQFFDYLKDYLELEKTLFQNMWGGILFYEDEEGDKIRYKWQIVALLIVVVCVIRGLACQFLWKTSSFLEGCLYPLFLFLICSICILPVWMIEQRYKKKYGTGCQIKKEDEKESNEIKPRVNFCKGLLKVLGVIAFLMFLLFGGPVLEEKLLSWQMGDGYQYVVTCGGYAVFWLVGLSIFGTTVWLYGKRGVFVSTVTNEGFKSQLPAKIKNRIFLGCVGIFLLTFVAISNWYDLTSDEGIIRKRILITEQYTWDEVTACKVYANHDGTLGYSLLLNNGKKAVVMGSMVELDNVDESIYPDGMYDYVLHIAAMCEEGGVPMLVEDWEVSFMGKRNT